MKILVAYSSAHGSTAEVAGFMGRILTAYLADVTVADVETVDSVDEYDAFVLGSPVHAAMWLQGMLVFIDRFKDQLAEKPVYFYLTCIRVLEEGSEDHIKNNYVHPEILKKMGVDAEDVAVFAGKLRMDAVSWDERWLLALRYDGNAIPGSFNHDYRDWKAIAGWVSEIADDLRLSPISETGKPVSNTDNQSDEQTEASDVVEF